MANKIAIVLGFLLGTNTLLAVGIGLSTLLAGTGCEIPCRSDEVADLGSAMGDAVATGVLRSDGDITSGSCGGSGGSDRAFTWTAPETGQYIFNTAGSDVDTVLYLRDGRACGVAELACDDDSGAELGTSSLEVRLDAGQTVVAIVDGFSSAQRGTFVVNVTRIRELNCLDGVDGDRDGLADCEDSDCAAYLDASSDLGSATGQAVFTGATVDAPNLAEGSCGGSAESEATFLWTAPAAGRYTFDTAGSDFETTVYLRANDCSSSAELGCSFFQSGVELILAEGQNLIGAIDGQFGESGSFVLNIGQATELVCTDGSDGDDDGLIDCQDSDCILGEAAVQDLGSALGSAIATGSTTDAPAISSASCGGGAPERFFSWTAPTSGTYAFDTEGSSFDTVLYLKPDLCKFAELSCDDDGGAGTTSRIEVLLDADQQVNVVVDGFATGSGSFVLNVQQVTQQPAMAAR